MAKDLVRTRNHVTKFYRMKAQMQAVSLRLQTLKSTAEMTKAMSGVTKAIVSMNKRMDMKSMQNVLREFAKQNEMMDMKEEMMSDMIDDAMEEEDDEIEEESLVSQIFDEIGLDLTGKIKDTPSGMSIGATEVEEEDTELQARLENLKK